MKIVRHTPLPTTQTAPTNTEATSFGPSVTIEMGDLSVTWHDVPAVSGLTVAAGNGEILLTAEDAAENLARFGAVVQIRDAGTSVWRTVDWKARPEFAAVVVTDVTNGVTYDVRFAWGMPEAHGPWADAPPLVPLDGTA